MTDIKNQGKTLNLNENHRSDGTELIPAEVNTNIPDDEANVTVGYTVNDERNLTY